MEGGLRIEGASLANIADGELERQFQEQLAKVVEVLNESELYEHTNNVLTVSVPMVCEFARHADTGALSVAVRADLKLPKRQRAVRSAFLRAGTIVVEATRQEELFPKTLRELRSVREEASPNEL
jgi:hypothetical protein